MLLLENNCYIISSFCSLNHDNVDRGRNKKRYKILRKFIYDNETRKKYIFWDKKLWVK